MRLVNSVLALLGQFLLFRGISCDSVIVSSKDLHDAQTIMNEQEGLMKNVKRISDSCESSGTRALQKFEKAYNRLLPYFKDDDSTQKEAINDESGKFKIPKTDIKAYAGVVQTYAHSQRELLDTIQISMDHAKGANTKAEVEYKKTGDVFKTIKQDFEHSGHHVLKDVHSSISAITLCKDRILEILKALEDVEGKLKEKIAALDIATTRLISYRYLFEALRKGRQAYISSYKHQVESVEAVDKITSYLKEAAHVAKKADLDIKEAKNRLFQIDHTAAVSLLEEILSHKEALVKENEQTKSNVDANKKDFTELKDLFNQIRTDVKHYIEKPDKGKEKILNKYKRVNTLKQEIKNRQHQSHAGKQSSFTIIVKIRKLYEEILKLLEGKTVKGTERQRINLPTIKVYESKDDDGSSTRNDKTVVKPSTGSEQIDDSTGGNEKLTERNGSDGADKTNGNNGPKGTDKVVEESSNGSDNSSEVPSEEGSKEPQNMPDIPPRYQDIYPAPKSSTEDAESENNASEKSTTENTTEGNAEESTKTTEDSSTGDEDSGMYPDLSDHAKGEFRLSPQEGPGVPKTVKSPSNKGASEDTHEEISKTEKTKKKKSKKGKFLNYLASLFSPQEQHRGGNSGNSVVQTSSVTPTNPGEPNTVSTEKLRQYNITDPSLREPIGRISSLIGTDGQEVINLIILAREFKIQFETLKYKIELAMTTRSAVNPMDLLNSILQRIMVDICKSVLKNNEL